MPYSLFLPTFPPVVPLGLGLSTTPPDPQSSQWGLKDTKFTDCIGDLQLEDTAASPNLPGSEFSCLSFSVKSCEFL